ncbi:MAG: hypothetical protein K8T89_24045 [Planctomycetes bacterium]|nr:hypothetical protein [Planctomycetota bacterium]
MRLSKRVDDKEGRLGFNSKVVRIYKEAVTVRGIRIVLIIAAGLIVLPQLTWSQPRGPGGPRGGNPDEIFDRFAKGKEVIVVSELEPTMKMGMQFFGSKLGLTGDQITRTQFKEALGKATAMYSSGKGPSDPASTTPPVSTTGTNSSSTQATPPKDSGNNERIESMFRRHDKNNDALLTFDEMTDTLKGEREKWDGNKDGFIDLNEYKSYMEARFAQREKEDKEKAAAAAAEPKKENQPNSTAIIPEQPKSIVEEIRPTVYRAGKLPKDIPDWFVKLDKDWDNDGQVGLYEWKKGGKDLEEFAKMDLNGDGFLTADEYLRWKAAQKPLVKGTESENLASNKDKDKDRDPRNNERPAFAFPGNGGGGFPGGGFGGGSNSSGATDGQPRFQFGGFPKWGEGGRPSFPRPSGDSGSGNSNSQGNGASSKFGGFRFGGFDRDGGGNRSPRP